MNIEHVGVVLNPSKFDDPQPFRDTVTGFIHSELGSETRVTFYDTTVEDPGFGQGKKAVDEGCDLVIAAGGDGTVRLVAGALAGTEATLGILPMGTGNLFARNLDVPIDDVEAALRVACEGETDRMDIGWLGHGSSADEASTIDKEPFLVIAGYGFDAVVMEKTDSRLKKYVGWLAYVVAGAQHIVGRGQSMRLTLDGRSAQPVRARTVMVGNVGRLPGGVTLMPGADASNGSLEILTLDWRGAAGFGQIMGEMVAPGAPSLAKISSKRTYQSRKLTVATDKALPVQVDGDFLGEATHLEAHVQPQALKIRAHRK